MAYKFFDMLRVATRDAILEGANQAGEVLINGTELATERTESVARLERNIHAVVGGEGPQPGRVLVTATPGAQAALPASEGPRGQAAGEGTPRPKPKATRATPPAPPSTQARPAIVNPADRRTPKATGKSEAMFDASPPGPNS